MFMLWCLDTFNILNELHGCHNWFYRTLMGIMDDYFDGYYSEEMIECQVVMGLCSGTFALLYKF